MIRSLIALLFLFISVPSFSQVEKFANSITPTDLQKHLYKIASKEMQGRETATEGQQLAAAYIEDQFKQHHLVPGWNGGYQQHFPVFRDSLIKATLNIKGTELEYDNDFAVTTNSGFNISLESGELLFAGFGLSDSTRDDYKGVNAKGKIVVVWPGAPTKLQKGKKIRGFVPDYASLQEAAKKNGATSLIIIQEHFPKGPSARTGRMYVRDFRQDSIPDTFVISDEMAKLIFGDELETLRNTMKTEAPKSKIISVPVKLELNRQMEHLESSNVIGMVEGTDKKDEAIIITAHYDHLGKRDTSVYYGADDDGSGTVTVLEIAEAYAIAADSGMKPRRTIIFMTVSGEEKGLWGSDFYSDNPAFPL
jgi:hypothetical protein